MGLARWTSWLLVAGCAAGTASLGVGDSDGDTLPDGVVDDPYDGPPNLLLVILDDVGTDLVGAYDVHPQPVPTPSLDALAARGVLFDNAIAEPVCSPARAALLTGLDPYRVGVGNPIAAHEDFAMDPTTPTLPRLLREGTGLAWPSAVLGKWHLCADTPAFADHPLASGFDHHRGTLGNLNGDLVADGSGPEGYWRYDKAEDGVLRVSRHYATFETHDDAIAFMTDAAEPWLAVVSYNAAHFPWHVPPAGLLDAVTEPVPLRPTDRDKARLMVTSVDAAVGRLVDGLDPAVAAHTWIVVVSDNGSSEEAAANTLQGLRSKGTLYRGGIRVPLIVVGPEVDAPGRRTDALVQLTDVAATFLDLVGATTAPPADAISFADVLRDATATGARTYAYAEQFEPNGPGPYRWQQQAIRDAHHKLVLVDGAPVQLFDEVADPYELDNLLRDAVSEDVAAIRDRLEAALPRHATP